MSTSNANFDIDQEIDRLVDKMSTDLKLKLKKMVERSEKLVLRDYATQLRQSSQNRTTMNNVPKKKKVPTISTSMKQKKKMVNYDSDSESDSD
tara:strand:- start:649 stop:927 length:279 start_codon:yes stop_codon:yes gene_type:complete